MKSFKYFGGLLIMTVLSVWLASPASAGAQKTIAALGVAVEQIEKSNIEVSPELATALKNAKDLKANHWKMGGTKEVYEKASSIFDSMIKLTKDTKAAPIIKPDWL